MASNADDKRYEDVRKIKENVQGGKAFGQSLSSFERRLDEIARAYHQENPDPSLEEIDKIKKKFVLYDLDQSGDIDLQELKLMMEKLGQPKTHVELKKMIAEVDKSGKGVIDFHSFLEMMLGKGSNSILKKILMFEELTKPKEEPKGPPAKKSFKDLP